MGKPTIVFILGGWHTADHFVDFLPYITPHYPVEIVSQPSVGINGSRGTLEEDAANSRAVIDRVLATGSDVVVVMHSYGGVVGACALKGLPAAAPGAPGVLMTVWLSAFVLPLGTSIFDGPSGVKGVLGPMSGSPWIKVDGEYSTADPSQTHSKLYNDLSAADSERYTKLLQPQKPGVFMEPVTYEPWHDLPSMYFFCDNDKAMPPAAQEKFAETLGKGRTEFRCSGSHFPWISLPEKVVEAIDAAVLAGENSKRKILS